MTFYYNYIHEHIQTHTRDMFDSPYKYKLFEFLLKIGETWTEQCMGEDIIFYDFLQGI